MPERPRLLYTWTIENAPLHQGRSLDAKYFKLDGRYCVVQSFQFGSGGPNADLGAIVFDVTGLPDVSAVREVARMRVPEPPGGFHNVFAYKHSDGRVLLFATRRGATAARSRLGCAQPLQRAGLGQRTRGFHSASNTALTRASGDRWVTAA